MSKIIAIWGSPGAGCTTFAVKLIKYIYKSQDAKVIGIFADNQTPALPVLFPNTRKEFLPSMGGLMSRTQIEKRDMLNYLVTFKKYKNVGFLGYADGENKYTYPEFSESKAKNLIETVSSAADYVIIDCSTDLNEPFNYTAVQNADVLIKLCAPTLKSVSYFSSQLPLYSDLVFKPETYIAGLVETEKERYMPLSEAKEHFGNIKFVIPYCGSLRQQLMDGKLLESVSDSNFNGKISKIAEMVATTIDSYKN